MSKSLLEKSLTLLLTITFCFPSFGSGSIVNTTQKKSIENKLEIQTSVFQTELYRSYKKNILESITIEEQKTERSVEQWRESDWIRYIDQIVKSEIIFKVENNNKTEKQQKKLIKILSDGLKDGVQGAYRSTISMGRKSGVEAVIAYLGGSATGYALMGVGMIIGSASMTAFFTVFPLGTIIASGIIAVQVLKTNLERKKAFNSNEKLDYYTEYKNTLKRVQKVFKVKEDDLVYSFSINHGIIIKKKSLMKSMSQFVGIGKSKLSIINLRRSLKKNNLYSKRLKKILRSNKLSYYEKIITVLSIINTEFKVEDKEAVFSRFDKSFVHNLPEVKGLVNISTWGEETIMINSLYDLPVSMRKAPTGVGFITIVKLYKDFIIPKLADSLAGVHFKEFKCLRSNLWSHLAKGYKNTNLDWNSTNEESKVFLEKIDSCLI